MRSDWKDILLFILMGVILLSFTLLFSFIQYEGDSLFHRKEKTAVTVEDTIDDAYDSGYADAEEEFERMYDDGYNEGYWDGMLRGAEGMQDILLAKLDYDYSLGLDEADYYYYEIAEDWVEQVKDQQ